MKWVVTGASSGIGKSLVLEIQKQGGEVLAIARSEGAMRELEAQGIQVLIADVSADGFKQNVLDRLERLQWDGVDVLVNNAGYLVNKPFEDVSSSDLDTSLEVNFKAPFQLIQTLLPLLVRRGGQVVNISTMGALNGTAKFPGLSAYSSSKGALTILTELLAEELKDKGVRVNALALGAVQTPMLEKAFPGYEASVTPEQMGSFIFSFAEDWGRLFNGKALPVSVSTP